MAGLKAGTSCLANCAVIILKTLSLERNNWTFLHNATESVGIVMCVKHNSARSKLDWKTRYDDCWGIQK